MAVSRNTLARGLGAARTMVGLTSLAGPRLARQSLGAGPTLGADGGTLARMFGIRDAAIGVATLSGDATVRRTGLKLGMVSDVADVGSVLLGRRGGVSGAGALLIGGAAAFFAVAGAVALRSPGGAYEA